MSYQVLSRKWRPQNFGDVVGQGHVTQTIQNAIKLERIGHGYIFTGPRGVGKTTVARVLAKVLNCKNPKENNPCNVCGHCEEITDGRNMDVLELDGASNRGIDEIRELRESVKYPPNSGNYRVYIIDEVHMLTKEAFNALLKTLEEPPKHVVFVTRKPPENAPKTPGVQDQNMFCFYPKTSRKRPPNGPQTGLGKYSDRPSSCCRGVTALR